MPKTMLLWPALGKSYNRCPPLGIAYLAAVLRENNLPVELVDLSQRTDLEKFEVELRQKNPDILGISVISVHYDSALMIAKIARRALPLVTIVFGGPHPTLLPEETLKNPEVDIVVSGEGEYKFLELVRAINRKDRLGGVGGIYYKTDGQIVKTDDSEYIEDLDKVPFPARDLLPMANYLLQPPVLPLPSPSTTIVPSRGCYGNCRFCQPTLKKLFGRKIRFRSPRNVVDEMAFLKREYNLKGLYFADDEPTWNRDWMMSLCEEINRRGLKIVWTCASRVDTVDIQLLETMKRAGCIQIGFGVESGSQRVLNYYRKGIKVEQVAPAFHACNKIGIMARANIMIGAPSETREDIQGTIQLLRQIRPDLIAVSVTTPTVGSDLFNDAKEKNLLRKESLSAYDRSDVQTMKRELSDQEIKQIIKEIVAVYILGIMRLVFNPRALYRKRGLFYYTFIHWLTMMKNPRALWEDISYYLNYAGKEKASA